MDFLEECKARGFFYQCTNEAGLRDAIKNSPIAYIGFDGTATSLHVGSLMQLMLLRLLQKHNIRPIVLLGGGTTQIGDPSGKDKARQLLSAQDIGQNFAGIKRSISKFVEFSNNAPGAIMLDNAVWLEKLNYMAFLRSYGTILSVNRMLTNDSAKLRLEREQHLSLLEFNYMALQAYDFLYLYEHHKCLLQCGGSDQWGNIIAGVDLIKRAYGIEAFGLTTPLITLSSGAKMGKTEQGAVWLNEELLSPYNYYQFWRNTDDRDVFRFMKLFTDLPVSQIETYERDSSVNINEHKKLLAFEATKLCHGEANASDAQRTAINAFEKNSMEGIESVTIENVVLEKGIPAYDLFRIAGLCSSNGEARRLIRDGGAKINQQKVTDENLVITASDFQEQALVLSSGKKRHIRVSIK